jgi:hypothetical protein
MGGDCRRPVLHGASGTPVPSRQGTLHTLSLPDGLAIVLASRRTMATAAVLGPSAGVLSVHTCPWLCPEGTAHAAGSTADRRWSAAGSRGDQTRAGSRFPPVPDVHETAPGAGRSRRLRAPLGRDLRPSGIPKRTLAVPAQRQQDRRRKNPPHYGDRRTRSRAHGCLSAIANGHRVGPGAVGLASGHACTIAAD